MNPTIALSATGRIRGGEPSASRNRFAEFLSSATRRRVKPKRDAMEQPRSDEDQQLVARTQAGEAAAFDELVVKYTPRLYGLVYNMTSNHEDTNDLLQDIFSKAYKSIGGFRGKSSFYTWIHSIAVNMTLNQGIPRAYGHKQPGARSRLVRAPAKIEHSHDEIV